MQESLLWTTCCVCPETPLLNARDVYASFFVILENFRGDSDLWII